MSWLADHLTKKATTIIITIAAVLVVGCWVLYFIFAAPPQPTAVAEQFTIPLGSSQSDVIGSLKAQGFIKNADLFLLILKARGESGKMQPGGYRISKSMDALAVARALGKPPEMIWVVIPEGLRKEEIAAILAKDLGWSAAEEQEFITQDTTTNPNYIEGVYFPDTYLISTTETSLEVAQRLQSTFNEMFAPYLLEANSENIKWTTALTVASIIQREAAGASDMPLISGIIWNRLLKKMPLDIDSTVQYARGDTPDGWWAPITPADEKIVSPYNTYLNAGLPPHPISDPGIEAISAALNPATTTCLYYLHDSSGQIHCSATYAGQVANIKLYLQ
jgi:UPF0755 protein